ncbi:SRPBCC family protein [Geodermatophilus sp. SYSU D00691]
MGPTRVTRHIAAPRPAVYRALLDRDAVARWKVPPGMTSEVHEWDAREGGRLRVSLTYDGADGIGKTTARTDTYSGHFAELVPDERVVEVDEFESDDPALRGAMTITVTLADADGGGTDLVAVHEGLPDVVPAEANELGWRESLARLAALVEG